MTGMDQFVRTMGLMVIAYSFPGSGRFLQWYAHTIWSSMRNPRPLRIVGLHLLASAQLASHSFQSRRDLRLKVRHVEFARCGKHRGMVSIFKIGFQL